MKTKLAIIQSLFIGYLMCFITPLSNAATVTVDKDNIRYMVDDVTMTAEVYGPVSSSTTITNLVIPDFIDFNDTQITVTSIRRGAFYENKNLRGSLTIGDNVQTIGDRAFSGCSGLSGSLRIGDNVQAIEGYAFWGCSGFTGSLRIPDKVQTIGERAFKSCTGFTGSLTIGDKVQTIGEEAFYDCTGFTGSLTIGDNVQTIGQSAFSGCRGFTGSLTIPDNVTTIGHSAFERCQGFTGSLTIGDKVHTIGYDAFYDCSGFTGSLTIPNSVQTIGSDAFGNCTGFTGSLTIGNNVQSIGLWAFFSCGFTSLFLPASISSYDNVFPFMRLREITCRAVNPPTIKSTTFYDSRETACLYVPAQSVSKYKSAQYWNEFNCINNIKVLPRSLAIEPTEITIGIKDTFELEIIILPEEAVDADLIFTSSNIQVANVDEDGIVTGLSEGKTTITVETENGLTATCEVTVIPVRAEYITLSANNLTLLVGQTDKLAATVTPENTTDKTVTWKSDNEAIATVGTDGTVTAVSVGVANITAICGEATATCKVTVNPVVASSVTLNVQDITLLVGQTDKLIATITPENTTDKTVTWKSDNEAIATVGADGTVTAVSVGVANITATCGEASATCKVTVNPVEVSSIELSLQDVTLLIGSITTLTAKVYPENATNQQITWTSDDSSIASIDDNGTITALQIGETIITATCGNASATCKVTVTPVSPSSIELNIKDMILYVGQSETIQAIVRPANTTYPTVTWQSGDEKVATVTADGKVTGISEGVVTIIASCGEVSAECTVTVNPIPASNIEITTGDVTLTIGNSTTLLAKVLPENTTHPEVEWVSSDPDIATITADGTVTGNNIGTAIITAKCGNVSATCTVTVIPVPSEGIVISPTSISMLLGEETPLTATVFPENTTDKTVTWGSDNPGVASVSSTGVVTALKLGTATITASNGSSKASCIVTVNPIVATSISLNVKDETIFVASTTQLVATISPANVTDKTITWTSSKPEIATVTDDGLVYGVAVGTTTITATIGSVSTTCQINVVHRIPDMDPSVTTSDRNIKTITGKPVNMAVYPAGGEPSGWSYSWTKNGEIVSRSTELNITAINDSETVIAEIYRVIVENEIDKVVIFSEIYDFVVQIYPAIDDDHDIDIIISTGNGSSNKNREGNIVNLSVKTPNGGNPQGWEYMWSDANGEIGNEESVETIATMSSGSSMDIEKNTYKLNMTNYSPDGDVWAQFNVESNLEVYRRPQTPLQLLRKGDGTSHTFVVMMPLSDSQLEQLNYSFVYGWTDSEGKDHILEQTKLRYCHADAEVYNNPTNKFWVYSVWKYQDGSVVSSGIRYLDGSADESFDASVFGENGESNGKNVKARSAVYTIDGQYMGSDPSRLTPGIYIYISETDGVMKSQKIIIR